MISQASKEMKLACIYGSYGFAFESDTKYVRVMVIIWCCAVFCVLCRPQRALVS